MYIVKSLQLEVTLGDLRTWCFLLGSSQTKLPQEVCGWPQSGRLPSCGASWGWLGCCFCPGQCGAGICSILPVTL